jgi:hypothetical protein
LFQVIFIVASCSYPTPEQRHTGDLGARFDKKQGAPRIYDLSMQRPKGSDNGGVWRKEAANRPVATCREWTRRAWTRALFSPHWRGNAHFASGRRSGLARILL